VVVVIALAVMTVKTGRSGIWLLLFLGPLSARGFKLRSFWDRLLPALGTVAVAGLAFALVRGPLPGVAPPLIARAIAAAHGSPVLADNILAEQVALAGGRVWLANPIDAFSKHDQDIYLDWMDGRPGAMEAIGRRVDVVLTLHGSPAERLMSSDQSFQVIASGRTAEMYVRRKHLPS
jgi:hypothetical protein